MTTQDWNRETGKMVSYSFTSVNSLRIRTFIWTFSVLTLLNHVYQLPNKKLKFKKYIFPDQQSRHASGYYERVYSNEFPRNAHIELRFGSGADNNCKGNTK